MTSAEYRSLIAALGLSIVGAAPVIGISRRASQYYAAGERAVPEPVARLLRLLARSPAPGESGASR